MRHQKVLFASFAHKKNGKKSNSYDDRPMGGARGDLKLPTCLSGRCMIRNTKTCFWMGRLAQHTPESTKLLMVIK